MSNPPDGNTADGSQGSLIRHLGIVNVKILESPKDRQCHRQSFLQCKTVAYFDHLSWFLMPNMLQGLVFLPPCGQVET